MGEGVERGGKGGKGVNGVKGVKGSLARELSISDDVKHGLKEVAALDLVQEGGTKKGISVSSPP